MAAPLTSLTSTSSPYLWSPEAEKVFNCLKTLFTTAPVLKRPDLSRQFFVEVDALDTGVGAVLSQRDPVTHRLHPCAFFSRRLSTPERNYDVGNRELLAVVWALQEWRHWLESTSQLFLIWTDHKNFTYLRTARRLNSCQARWALFLSRFNFTLSYRPGSRNAKPDALSRVYSPPSDNQDPDFILNPRCVVGAASWEIQSIVKEAQSQQPDPGTGPPSRLFVPDSTRSPVLQWAHSSKLTCHPGFQRTLQFLRRSFWMPGMARDAR